MTISRNQFKILSFLADNSSITPTQREISVAKNLSLGTINATIAELLTLGYIDKDYKITQSGKTILESYRVKNAIILSAGFGARLIPVTLNTPKSLVRVGGVRIIDTIIDALKAADINDITIVSGYLGEQFEQLKVKYGDLNIVYNKEYATTNNISSAMLVRNKLKNAYVFDGDIIVKNPKIISKYQYTSNYVAIHKEITDDWCLKLKGNYISGMAIGGYNTYLMFGFSYWTHEDGEKLEKHIKAVYDMPGGKENYWDQVAVEHYSKEYKIEIRPVTDSDIIEIDTYEELKEVDGSYN